MRTRIILGIVLAILAVGMFVIDHRIGRSAPCMLIVSVILAIVGSLEFCRMIPAVRRPPVVLCVVGSVALLLAHWVPLVEPLATSSITWFATHSWTIYFLVALTVATASYQGPGESVNRLGLSLLVVAYLGVLPGYLIDLRLMQPDPLNGTACLLLAVFVPKCCDIGAYFTGSFIGRTKMSPVLSPKKTWEGAAGGLLTATAFASVMQWKYQVIPGGWVGAAAFGISIGIAGIIGDLAESLIKRDCGSKDAGNVLPEYGGVLDIVDSILFAAPLIYWWLRAV